MINLLLRRVFIEDLVEPEGLLQRDDDLILRDVEDGTFRGDLKYNVARFQTPPFPKSFYFYLIYLKDKNNIFDSQRAEGKRRKCRKHNAREAIDITRDILCIFKCKNY